MIYVASEKALYTDEGEFIKWIDCPLASSLAKKVSAADSDRSFKCPSCSSKVHNLRFLNDQQALDMAQDDPNVCFFATAQANNVKRLDAGRPSASANYGNFRKLPVVRTARGLAEINFAAVNGFKLIFRQVPLPGEAIELLALSHNQDTGKFFTMNDQRVTYWPEEDDPDVPKTTVVLPFFHYPVIEQTNPLAAYVIPPDLEPGTDVFLEDLIEDLIRDGTQGTQERLKGWHARWDGTDVRIYPHPKGDFLG